MNKKKGFTLAEILVTITLLGIVAAIIIPTAIHNYQKKIFITKYKTTYATLQAAFAQNAILTNYVPLGSGANNASHMTNMLLQNIKGTKKGVWGTTYNGTGVKLLNGSYTGIRRHDKITLSTGVEINVGGCNAHWVDEVFVANYVGDCSAEFNIDVNGEAKGPNVMGKDIFYLVGLKDGSLYPFPLPTKYTSLYLQPVYTRSGSISEKHKTCNLSNSSGYGCSSWFLTHSDYDK